MKHFLTVMIGLCLCAPAIVNAKTPSGGGKIDPPSDRITPEQRRQINAMLSSSINDLRKKKIISALPAGQSIQNSLLFPLRRAADQSRTGFYGISNFVDLDTQHNTMHDWKCESRTYDGHGGIDYFLFPFQWRMMDRQEIDIIAAAPGTIAGKQDGNDDRSCPANYTEAGRQNWNAVYVRHADGTVAWYGHMKKSSLTAKPVGASVSAGEFLGKVGSSGFSTGPHLHFELHDQSGAILEPNSDYGTCNKKPSLWENQLPYHDSRINLIATHHSPPPNPGDDKCPNPVAEEPNFSDRFTPGSTVYFSSFYQDQLPHQNTEFLILRPDGSTYRKWSFDMSEATTAPHYPASYWYWQYDIPSDAMTGTWKFRAKYQSVTYDHDFLVSKSTNPDARNGNDFDGNGKSDLFWRHALTGRNIIWESGDYYDQWSPGNVADPNWKVAGSGDFDGDGKSDLFWRNAANGQNIVWPSADGNRKYTTTAVATAWKVAAVGDFNGDGRADIFWRNDDNGQDIIWWSGSYAARTAEQTISTAWKVAGSGDLNGDGKDDVVWRNTLTGANIVWWSGKYAGYSNLTGVTTQAWKVAAVGDFNGDGRADMFWRNDADGRNIVWWSGNYSTQTSETAIKLEWDVVTSGDYDGDGSTDIIWRNRTTGQTVWWPNARYATRINLMTITDPNWKIAR